MRRERGCGGERLGACFVEVGDSGRGTPNSSSPSTLAPPLPLELELDPECNKARRPFPRIHEPAVEVELCFASTSRLRLILLRGCNKDLSLERVEVEVAWALPDFIHSPKLPFPLLRLIRLRFLPEEELSLVQDSVRYETDCGGVGLATCFADRLVVVSFWQTDSSPFSSTVLGLGLEVCGRSVELSWTAISVRQSDCSCGDSRFF
jgi:hypothetical protein